MRSAERSCCDDVFAIVEITSTDLAISRTMTDGIRSISADYGDCSHIREDYKNGNISVTGVPMVTIRMHPSAVADTRNYK
jgi:hypothetical protein